MSPIETAYVAGILEGEGCFSIHTKRGVSTSHPRITVNMTDEDIIRRIHEWTGVGNVTGPYKVRFRGREMRPSYRWCCARKADVLNMIRQVYPTMGERRRSRIREVLQQCYDKEQYHGVICGGPQRTY